MRERSVAVGMRIFSFCAKQGTRDLSFYRAAVRAQSTKYRATQKTWG